ncbi:MAG: hypothetical protein ACPG80_01830, partial [Rickettsiales bacterium]
KAFGVHGLEVHKPSEVDGMIKEMMKIKGPVLCNIYVDQNENVYPMIPAGAAHNELVLHPKLSGGKDGSERFKDKSRV